MKLEVKQTTDYGKFKSVTGNRFIKNRHVEKLSKSILEKNLLPYQPVIVTRDMFIIDGQHRIEAAKKLDIPIYYTIVPELKLNDIQMLNANMKVWNLRDFVESYAKVGNKNYSTLLEFSDNFSIPLSISAYLLAGVRLTPHSVSGACSVHGVPYAIRSGDFKITALDEATSLAKQLKELQQYCEGPLIGKSDFIRALVRMNALGMKQTRLIEKIQKYGLKLHRKPVYRDYLLQFQDAYNFRMRKNRIDAL